MLALPARPAHTCRHIRATRAQTPRYGRGRACPGASTPPTRPREDVYASCAMKKEVKHVASDLLVACERCRHLGHLPHRVLHPVGHKALRLAAGAPCSPSRTPSPPACALVEHVEVDVGEHMVGELRVADEDDEPPKEVVCREAERGRLGVRGAGPAHPPGVPLGRRRHR